MENCEFCKIVSGTLKAAKVYEDDGFLAFMDRKPINPGHLLVIPKTHYETILHMPSSEMGLLFSKVGEIAKALVLAMKADGLNLGQNNGIVANQVIPHVHVHLVPRYSQDSLDGRWPSRRDATMDELESIAGRIRKGIASLGMRGA